MNPPKASAIIEQLQAAIAQQLQNQKPEPILVGIYTGGVWVAEALHQALELSTPLGKLNNQYHRDDLAERNLQHQVLPTDIPININDSWIILVDDVLHTGRSVRSALAELFEYGRPAKVDLAILVDRPLGRELPIQPNYVGWISPQDHPIKLTQTATGQLNLEWLE